MNIVTSNKQILLYLFICLVCHFCVLYSVGSLIYGIYSQENYDGTIPFNFKQWIDFGNCCDYSDEEMVNMLSLVVSYPISGLVFGFLVTVRVWDFCVTVTIIHVALCCLVMLDFPTNWSWWVCLGIGCILMVSIAEGVAAIRRYRNRARLVVPEKNTQEPVNYMFR